MQKNCRGKEAGDAVEGEVNEDVERREELGTPHEGTLPANWFVLLLTNVVLDSNSTGGEGFSDKDGETSGDKAEQHPEDTIAVDDLLTSLHYIYVLFIKSSRSQHV